MGLHSTVAAFYPKPPWLSLKVVKCRAVKGKLSTKNGFNSNDGSQGDMYCLKDMKLA